MCGTKKVVGVNGIVGAWRKLCGIWQLWKGGGGWGVGEWRKALPM